MLETRSACTLAQAYLRCLLDALQASQKDSALPHVTKPMTAAPEKGPAFLQVLEAALASVTTGAPEVLSAAEAAYKTVVSETQVPLRLLCRFANIA